MNGSRIRIGVPQTRVLVPAARLYSRLVVIKGFLDPEPFLEAARRQLAALEIRGEPSLIPQPEIAAANLDKPAGTHSSYLRRTVRIRDKEIVGFALRVQDLTAEESIRLQEEGLGGRRRFGCGVFVPNWMEAE
ncbi:MAG: type I-MYXAN CRISPR-associated protein Cas6/Cmx6 [Planctomycetota bacterium]